MRGQEALSEVRMGQEHHPEVWVGSGDPPGGSEGVGRLSQRSGRVRRPSWKSGRGRDTLPEVQEESGYSLRGPGGVGSPTLTSGMRRDILQDMFGWGRDAHQEVQEES